MKWIFSLFCLFAAAYGKPLNVSVSAEAAILVNPDTKAVLYEKNGYKKAFPASITKVATALYVLDKKNPNFHETYKVSNEALKLKPTKPAENVPSYWGEWDGSKMGLLRGEVVSLDSLLYGLMRVSGNDAANVIAEAFADSIPDFVGDLNSYLYEIGCTNTQFSNPHGLHAEDHFTTPYDMSLITARALQFSKFRELVSNDFYEKPPTNKQPSKEIAQANALLKPGKYFYPKAIGVKTGYHSKAKNTLVAAAEHEGRVLIAVLLGCKNKGDRYEDAIRLFETAFSETKQEKRLFGRMHQFIHPIQGLKTPLKAILRNEISLEYFPSEEPNCKAFVSWDPVHLPIRRGDRVGEVHIASSNGEILKKEELFAREEIKSNFLYWAKTKLGIL